MALVQRRWVCPRCLREGPPAATTTTAAPIPPAADPAHADADAGTALAGATASSPSVSLQTLQRIDRAVRGGQVAARVVLYGLLLLFAVRSPIGIHVLTGVLWADVASWAVAAWFDVAMHRLAVLWELALYAVVGIATASLGGGLQLPLDSEGRAVVALTGMMTLGLKLGLFAWKILWGERTG